MRPRHKAAEYVEYFDSFDIIFNDASMRPRHKAAEYSDS